MVKRQHGGANGVGRRKVRRVLNALAEGAVKSGTVGTLLKAGTKFLRGRAGMLPGEIGEAANRALDYSENRARKAMVDKYGMDGYGKKRGRRPRQKGGMARHLVGSGHGKRVKGSKRSVWSGKRRR
jgi:hypothetical protein